jgi:hypothetical protein
MLLGSTGDTGRRKKERDGFFASVNFRVLFFCFELSVSFC